MKSQNQPAKQAIRRSAIAAAAVGVSVGMVIGAVGTYLAIKQHPTQSERRTTDARAAICNNEWHSIEKVPVEPAHGAQDK